MYDLKGKSFGSFETLKGSNLMGICSVLGSAGTLLGHSVKFSNGNNRYECELSMGQDNCNCIVNNMNRPEPKSVPVTVQEVR